ncbi:hypothetical protein [Alteromonas stellipolaris]|uniref:hypothetical protein n=1 Tax=Alteromonas stellipolaris TaxID=233316 RepID=UPI001D8D7267|nr:hypothetical protein [Alteromonas stellipolaris]MBZ2163217.1 hypothetical protein [Alteromonas stellipolaris]
MDKLKRLPELLLFIFVGVGLYHVTDAFNLEMVKPATELGRYKLTQLFSSFRNPLSTMLCVMAIIAAVHPSFIKMARDSKAGNFVQSKVGLERIIIFWKVATTLVLSPLYILTCNEFGKTFALIIKAFHLGFEDSSALIFLLNSVLMLVFIILNLLCILLFKYCINYKAEHLSNEDKWYTKIIGSSTKTVIPRSIYIGIGLIACIISVALWLDGFVSAVMLPTEH